MILLKDNDILIKLAQCDLIAEALEVFESDLSSCYVLDTARYALFLDNPNKCIERRVGSLPAYDRLCGLIGACTALSVAHEDIELLEELFALEYIDPGEQTLIMHANSIKQAGGRFLLASGDKNALRSIERLQGSITRSLLLGNVDCLESIILKIIYKYGFDYVNSKICHALVSTDLKLFDTVLRMSFGSGRDQEHARSCLMNYVHEVLPLIRP